MKKTILLTGATDGIGLETAKLLVEQGHDVLIHGRSQDKLDAVESMLKGLSGAGLVESYIADLSKLSDVKAFAEKVTDKHSKLDVLINNAGVLKAPQTVTEDGLDLRFAVNTVAPYLLTKTLLPILSSEGRVVNLSSAAQSPVNIDALLGKAKLTDSMSAYAQSKLAITMWSRAMASANTDGPAIIAVNPGSLLASKMVKEGFGVAGNDLSIGADILVRASLSDEFADASGKYFDNDSQSFANPHSDALDNFKSATVLEAIELVLEKVKH